MKSNSTKPLPPQEKFIRMAKNGKKNLIVGVFLAFLMISCISAMEWDNVKSYDPGTKTITITNALGLGGTISTIRLDSELNEMVLEGEDQKVAEFTISSLDDYSNALKNIELYHINKGMQNFERLSTYKYKVPGTAEVKNDKVCQKEVCEYVDGKATKIIDSPTWVPLNKKVDLLKDQEITIGIFMDVTAGEVIEWIPTFFGVEIDEWAIITVVAGHGEDDDTTSGANAKMSGITIEINTENIRVTRLTQFTEDANGATKGYILNFDNTTLASCDFVGLNCTFASAVSLSANTIYRVAGDQDAVIFGARRYNSASYPYATTYLDFIYPYKGTTDPLYSNELYLIEFITFDVEALPGEVDLIEPVDYANLSSSSVLFNASGNYTNSVGHGVTNMTLYLDGTLNTTIYNSSAQENLTLGTTLSVPEGFHSWSANISTADGTSYNSSNWSFTVDTISPSVSIIYPTDTEDYGVSGQTEYVNWTVSDTNLGSCIVNYNSINTTVLCADLNDSITLVDGVYTATVWANDTMGNWGFDTQTWAYDVFQTAHNYVASVVESSTNEFDMDITYDSGSWDTTSGNIWYNSTKYSATKTGTGDDLTFTKSITAPIVDAAINKSFHWEINLVNVTGTYSKNYSTFLQLVSPINMSLCGYPHTVPYINFTIYNEDTLVEMNGTIELTFNYRGVDAPVAGAKVFTFSNTTGNESRYSFCFSPSNANYTVDSTLQYGATGYTNKFYNFQGVEFYNTTTEIGLYLLNSNDSTSFIVEVRDEDYQPISEVEVYIQRFDATTNTWYTIEIAETDDDGQIVQHIYTEDALYRFKVYDDGTLLYTSSPKIITCPEQPCTVTIVLSETITDPLENFQDLSDFESSLTYDSSSEQVTFTYSDTSGNLTQARLYVIRNSYGETDLGYSCNLTSTSDSASLGGANCDLTTSTNGSYLAVGYLRRGGDEITVERTFFIKIRDIIGALGTDGILISFFFLMGIVMLGIYRPSLGIIFTVAGVILVQALQLMQITVTALVAVIGIGIILLVEVRKQ